MPKPQKTSNPKNRKKQEKQKDSAAGKEKAKNRKELTGRDHQGNHDSNTKETKRHDDRHDHGIKVAGRAGSKR